MRSAKQESDDRFKGFTSSFHMSYGPIYPRTDARQRDRQGSMGRNMSSYIKTTSVERTPVHAFDTSISKRPFSSMAGQKHLGDTSNRPVPKKTKLEKTINHSIKADRSARSEFVVSLCENRSRQVGFCAFSSFSARIVIGTIIDNALYENTVMMLNCIFPLEVYAPENHKDTILLNIISRNFTDTKVMMLSTKFYNEGTGFTIYRLTKNYKLDFELDKNYLAFGALSSIHFLFNENSFNQHDNLLGRPEIKNRSGSFFQQKTSDRVHDTREPFDHKESGSHSRLSRELAQYSFKPHGNFAMNYHPPHDHSSRQNVIYETQSSSRSQDSPMQKIKNSEKFEAVIRTDTGRSIKHRNDFLEKANWLRDRSSSIKSNSMRIESEVRQTKTTTKADGEGQMFDELDFRYLSIEIYEQYKYLLVDHNTLKDLELLQNLENGHSSFSLFSIFKCRTSAGVRYLRGALCQPLKDLSEIEKRLEIIEYFRSNPSIYHILHQRLTKLSKSDNLALRFLKKPTLYTDSAVLRFYATVTDLYFFLKEYVETYEEIFIEKNRLIAIGRAQDDPLSSLINEATYKESLEILKMLEELLDFSLTKAQNNRKDNYLFLLRDKDNMFIELAKHSYSRLYENLLELFENHKQGISKVNFGELVLSYTANRRYHLKLKVRQFQMDEGTSEDRTNRPKFPHVKPYVGPGNQSQDEPVIGERIRGNMSLSNFKIDLASVKETTRYRPNRGKPTENKPSLQEKAKSQSMEQAIHKKIEAKLSSILNEEVIFCHWKNRTLKFTTPSFANLNSRIDKCSEEILSQTIETVLHLYQSIQSRLFFIVDLNHAIAYIDLLIAFTELSVAYNFQCRPQFINTRFKCLKIERSINPIFFASRTGLATSIRAPSQMTMQEFFMYGMRNVKLIVSSNESGKTLYLKHLAFLVILAQNGSFLPCHHACLFIFDRLTVKLNLFTSTENSMSNLKQELLFIDRAIDSMKDDQRLNLILIDEFARSTNPAEVISYYNTFLELATARINSFIVMTSVHSELCALQEDFEAIEFLTLQKFGVAKLHKLSNMNNEAVLTQFLRKGHAFWSVFEQNYRKREGESSEEVKKTSYFEQFDAAVELFFRYFFNDAVNKEALQASIHSLIKSIENREADLNAV